MLKKTYDIFCMRFETDAKAYLILPLTQATLHSSSGDDTFSFAVDSVLDLKKLTDLTVEQRRKFRTAAAVLNLHAYDAREYESGYQDDLEPCDCSSFGDEKHFHSDSESDESVRLESAISKKDIKQQDGTEKQEAKQDSGAVYMEALSPSARSSSNQTPPKPKLEKKELQPELMMLACGDYYLNPS
ncbi:MAG: hypothetical protein Q9199_005046 [Rusavskia elegans]